MRLDELSAGPELLQRWLVVVNCRQVEIALRRNTGLLIIKLDAHIHHGGYPSRHELGPTPLLILTAHVQVGRDLADLPDGRAGEDAHRMIRYPKNRRSQALLGNSFP